MNGECTFGSGIGLDGSRSQQVRLEWSGVLWGWVGCLPSGLLVLYCRYHSPLQFHRSWLSWISMTLHQPVLSIKGYWEWAGKDMLIDCTPLLSLRRYLSNFNLIKSSSWIYQDHQPSKDQVWFILNFNQHLSPNLQVLILNLELKLITIIISQILLHPLTFTVVIVPQAWFWMISINWPNGVLVSVPLMVSSSSSTHHHQHSHPSLSIKHRGLSQNVSGLFDLCSHDPQTLFIWICSRSIPLSLILIPRSSENWYNHLVLNHSYEHTYLSISTIGDVLFSSRSHLCSPFDHDLVHCSSSSKATQSWFGW